MQPIVTSPELLAAVAGALLSLGFSYIPKLNTKWAVLTKEKKQMWMGILILGVTAGIFGLGCLNFLAILDFACTQATANQFIWMAFYALAANQSVFSVSPETKSVKAVKLARDIPQQG